MTDGEIVELLRARGSPALRSIGGEVLAFDQVRREVTMRFEATPEMCHSEVIVQGGYLTAMVDSAMAFAAMGTLQGRASVPTLEIKVSFLESGNPGPVVAKAWAVRLGRTIGFLEGELYQRETCIVTSSSTVRIVTR